MAYRIRAVLGEDWPRVRELRLAALADPLAAVAFNETYEWALQQGEGFWRRRAAQGEEGQPAETYVGEDVEDEGRWAGGLTVLEQGRSALVVAVYVRPEHRGTGLADQLFEAAEGWARRRPGVLRMRLHVHEHNPRAEAFYLRVGYAHTGYFESDPKAPSLREYEMVRELDGLGDHRSW